MSVQAAEATEYERLREAVAELSEWIEGVSGNGEEAESMPGYEAARRFVERIVLKHDLAGIPTRAQLESRCDE